MLNSLIHECERYLPIGSRKIRKLVLFLFTLGILWPKSVFQCVYFYLKEIFFIFEVMIEKAENTINSLIKLLIIIIKRDL